MENTVLFLLTLFILLVTVLTKEIDSKQDLQQEESVRLPAEHRAYPGGEGPVVGSGSYVGPGLSSVPGVGDSHDYWPTGRPDMPQIKNLNVKCEKNHMKVSMEFDRPFFGMIFSKGHYSDHNCVHLPPGTGHALVNFQIFLGKCGMSSSQQQNGVGGYGGGQGGYGDGLFIENTIIIQYDPQLQEIWDQARRLRCTWYDFYEKAVTFRPFNVDMLDAVTANFLGDNIQCWMQIQVGKGPWANEISGIVKIGQTMTMVLAIKDEEHKFDMFVRNCIAHDGKSQPIQLVDEYGCVVRPKIMSGFQKIKNFGTSASVASYAYFQAFKFPDSMNVHFQCVIQVCRYECPVPKCGGELGGGYLPAPRDPSFGYSEPKPTYTENEGQSNQHLPSNPGPQEHSNGAPSVFLNRNGELPNEENNITVGGGYAIFATGGLPRSSDASPRSNNAGSRRKRQIQDTKDIQTQRTIQVVAPGDVAFNLPFTADNESVVDVYSHQDDYTSSSICMSFPGFAVGMIFLLLLLIVSSLVAVFLFFRVRQLTSVKGPPKEKVIPYDNPEFVRVVPMGH
ncbi:uncharacterized protein LOC106462816 [Limulus polyphemus]|uniref:Uncharacterized protein LOC106462816 n=1 Tax=Limulus polyphemus TaxID=6850 RepID=A0ABM1SQJ1_LIMPO|nr:uncharacterized protein LOC106462816 [Limulus polyphemus]